MEDINVYPVFLPDLVVDNKRAIIKVMVEAAKHNVLDANELVEDIMTHESEMETDMLPSVAIPHAKSAAVTTPFIAVGKIPQGIIWNNQNKVTLVIMLAAGENAKKEHLSIISRLALNLADDDFLDDLLRSDIQEVADKIRGIYE